MKLRIFPGRSISLYRILALVFVLAVSAAGPLTAQPKGGARNGGPARPGPGAAKLLERLSKMPPEQRARMMDRLPPERRERIQRQLEAYNRMTPEERDRLHRQVEVFQQLPPERQDAARRAFRRYNNLPPERQSMLREELQLMRRMTPAERSARFNSGEFRSRFNGREQQLLEELSGIMPPQ